MLALASGCSFFPDIKHKPQFYNPFPQIHQIAVLPFVNQSEEPTLSGQRVALAYANELLEIPGFEVLPQGAVKLRMAQYQGPLASGEDFQRLAQFLGVDAVLVGSVTDYSPYYPPRMSMKVNWYAANPGFHPILPGYGLPWGTKDEKKIPRWVHHAAQRALATEQLKTQTPDLPSSEPAPLPPIMPEDRLNSIESKDAVKAANHEAVAGAHGASEIPSVIEGALTDGGLPPDWPDPRGFIPDGPSPTRPVQTAQSEPIISHMSTYNGHDEEVTQRLSEYFYYRDDARFGGWQAYLQRSEDFIRACCYFHVTETLAVRGGQDESRLIFRWPIDRYQR